MKKPLGEDRLAANGDAFYARLMAAHNGLTPEESAALNARLVLLLANLVGDIAIINETIERARRSPR